MVRPETLKAKVSVTTRPRRRHSDVDPPKLTDISTYGCLPPYPHRSRIPPTAVSLRDALPQSSRRRDTPYMTPLDAPSDPPSIPAAGGIQVAIGGDLRGTYRTCLGHRYSWSCLAARRPCATFWRAILASRWTNRGREKNVAKKRLIIEIF